MLMADPDVATVGSRLGSSRQGTSGSFNIDLKTRAEGRKDDTFAVLARLSAKAANYPDLNLRLRPVQDLPSGGGGGTSQGAQYQVSLQGNDLASLQEWLPKLQTELKKNPKLMDVGTDVDEAGLRQNMVIDRDKAARLGVSIGAIDGALYDAFGQRQVSTIYSDINQYQVVVNALPEQTATPEALNRIYVRSSSGQMIPITAFARQEPGLAPSQITHENQYTTMDLSFNLAPGVSMGEAMAIIQSTVEEHAHARRHPGADGQRLPPLPAIAERHGLADPGRGAHRLHRARHAVRKPDPSGHHPVHPAGRRRRCAAGAVDHRHRTVGGGADRAGAVDRHRQEKRDHDDRLRPGRRTRTRQAARWKPRAKPASCASARS